MNSDNGLWVKAKEIENEYDVIIAGGGPAGIAAAISCGRNGLKTLLVEFTGSLGGTSTSGALPFFLGAMTGSIPFRTMLDKNLQYKDLPRPQEAVKGIFLEIINRIKKENGGVGPSILAQTDKYPGLDRLGCHDEFTFDIEIGKRVFDEMVTEAGTEILFHSMVIAAKTNDRVVQGVYISNKDGITYAKAKSYIDCSGDADMVNYAGFDTYKGDRITGEMTAVSLVAHIEGIDSSKIEQYLLDGGDPWFYDSCKKAIEKYPEANLPKTLIIFPMVQPGVFMINGGTAFGGIDGLNPREISKHMITGRKRGNDLIEKLFRPYMPGAKNCRLRLTAVYPGVRETRRIVAEYMFTEQDIMDRKKFKDTVALAGRHFDLARKSGQPMHDMYDKASGGVSSVPYSAMIPKDTRNIIAAGRCIAADGQALGPVRIMSTCFALGEAAGEATALRMKENVSYKDIDIDILRGNLKAKGAVVDPK